MLDRLAVLLALAVVLGAAGCGTATPDASKAEGGVLRSTPFESRSAGNGTGAFFRPVGAADDSGVQNAWPQ